jgi:AhpD family alkylhydroperoxidase
MVSDDAQVEIEQYLGRVPSWIESLAEPAADPTWGIVRDLQLEETDLPDREKALIGLGAAAAIQCPYCVHFHTEEAKLDGVGEEELAEAVNVAGTVRYLSTVLHGRGVDFDEFVDETSEIVEHVREQQAAAGD